MILSKPFELKALGNDLLAKAKSIALPATESVLDWTSQSCLMVDNTIVKIVGGVVAGSKPAILAEVAKAVGAPAPAVAVASVK